MQDQERLLCLPHPQTSPSTLNLSSPYLRWHPASRTGQQTRYLRNRAVRATCDQFGAECWVEQSHLGIECFSIVHHCATVNSSHTCIHFTVCCCSTTLDPPSMHSSLATGLTQKMCCMACHLTYAYAEHTQQDPQSNLTYRSCR